MELSSLDQRRDNRTVEVFEANIEQGTEIESLWGEILRQDFTDRGHPCKIEETGVDNSGKLITGKLKNHNADKKYVFESGNSQSVEIKTAPLWLKKFFSFKSFGLKSCEKQGAYIMVPRLENFYLFKPEIIPSMLNNYEHKIYPGFSPNDIAVRIPMDDIENWVSQGSVIKREWTEGAKSLIQKHMAKLTEDRKK